MCTSFLRLMIHWKRQTEHIIESDPKVSGPIGCTQQPRDHSRWNKWLLLHVPNDQFTLPSLTQDIHRVIFSIIPKIIGSHQLTWHFASFFYLNKTEKELSSGSNKIFLQQAKRRLVLFGAVEDNRWAGIFIHLTDWGFTNKKTNVHLQ